MGLKKFIIFLDQPVYHSGQTITGRLLVHLDKPKSMKAIYLKYTGKGKVEWTETEQRQISTTNINGDTTTKTENYTVTYSNSENYLGLQQLVFGNDTNDSVLPEGEHLFIFKCQLPMNLPSSFEGKYGRIRYCIEARIIRPWKFDNVITQTLTVTSILDLNRLPLATMPVAERTSKSFWLHSKQLIMSVDLPVRGFVPGQTIPIKISLNNESGIRVKTLFVTLEQEITFHATSKSRTVQMIVHKNEHPLPEGLENEEVESNLRLPSVPPSYLDYCKIIDLNYQLSITARVKPWYHKDLKIRTELIVGNIPIMNYQKPIPFDQSSLFHHHRQDNLPYNNETQPENRPPAYGFVLPPEMMYEDLPPPTYEESMRMEISGGGNNHRDKEYENNTEIEKFSPLYPVYKFENT